MLNNNIYYTTKGIYGIQIYTYINKEYKMLFKQELNTLMTNEMIEEVKVFYSNLDEKTKTNVKIKIYKNCKSIENEDNYMIWHDTPLNTFITCFGI
jgi:hypothetical protein